MTMVLKNYKQVLCKTYFSIMSQRGRKITTHKTFEKMNEQESRQVMESCSSHQQKVEIKGT